MATTEDGAAKRPATITHEFCQEMQNDNHSIVQHAPKNEIATVLSAEFSNLP
jgi:hypothetical protein